MKKRPGIKTQLWVLGILVVGTLIAFISFQKNEVVPKHDKVEETPKRADGMNPNELFFADRNYPDYTVNYEAFMEQKKSLMLHDKLNPPSRRGLDAEWTLQGPGNIGGRVNVIAVHPTDPAIIFIGYSQGGIYRTEDGGQNWTAVFDDQASLTISDIKFDPTQSEHMWATTGDVNISGYHFIGTGIYESKDGGRTWQNKGLEFAGVLSKIAIDQDPQYIYVGSMGLPAQKGSQKGIFRSINGGNTWEQTLFIDDSTGIIDIVTDKTMPGRVFATSWTRVRSNTRGITMGPGTGVYRSDDYGASWVNLTNDLPSEPHSRTSVEITNDGTVFVSYVGTKEDGFCVGETEILEKVFKSTDSGTSWDTIPIGSTHNLPCDALAGFGWYFEAIKVNPENPDDIFILGVDLFRSVNGGLYWQEAAPPWWLYDVHADKHDLVFAHGLLYLGTDGGAYRTDINNTDFWEDFENIPSTQFYRTAWNPHTPDQYYGGAQDNGTTGGNENNFNEWPRILGGDGFQPLFDKDEPLWMYATTQNGAVYFSEDGGFDFDNFNEGLYGSRYWDMPFVQSPLDPKILFAGSYRVFTINMKDSLREWYTISPDLTKGDTILGNRYPTITAIAQSPLDSLRLYAGTQDGLIWTTDNGGTDWLNITDGTPGMFVTSIQCSHVKPQGVFATYSGYRDNHHQPYIFKSENAGLDWIPIAEDIPMMGVNNLFIMPSSEDTIMLVGTDGGVYVTFDEGLNWDRVGSNMPYFPVYDIDYNPVDNKIIAATFSRGIMTFPLDELQLETSVEPDIALEDVVEIWPTISDGTFNIKWDSGMSAGLPIEVSFVDGSGKVLEKRMIFNEDKNEFRLSRPYSPGLYYFKLHSGNQYATKAVILQK